MVDDFPLRLTLTRGKRRLTRGKRRLLAAALLGDHRHVGNRL